MRESNPERVLKTDCALDAREFFEATRDLMRSFCVTARAYDKFSNLSNKPSLCRCLQAKLAEPIMQDIRTSLEASMKIFGDLAATLIK